jgi:hypothetical protein
MKEWVNSLTSICKREAQFEHNKNEIMQHSMFRDSGLVHLLAFFEKKEPWGSRFKMPSIDHCCKHELGMKKHGRMQVRLWFYALSSTYHKIPVLDRNWGGFQP